MVNAGIGICRKSNRDSTETHTEIFLYFLRKNPETTKNISELPYMKKSKT